MYLRRLSLQNYRNYAREELVPHERINFLYGENAQGKTNLLEAVYLLGTGKSPRNARDQEITRWGENWYRVAADVERRDYSFRLEISYRAGTGKIVAINGQKQESLFSILGRVNVVLFSPEELQLVKGEPSQRRRFLNLQLSQTSPRYYYYLQQYRRVLQQRNILLKDIRSGRTYRRDELPVWDRQLVKIGAGIVWKRREMVAKLAPLARDFHKRISGGREILTVEYKPSFPGGREGNVEEIEDSFSRALLAAREEEIQRRMTVVGPHRDDLLISLNGRDGRVYGSQGQQKTAALSLKLAESQYMEGEMGEYPILLLDDIMSELDGERRQFVLETVQERGQVFITGTGEMEMPPGTAGNCYRVVQGTIIKV
ncbi:MAG TPA: DNA replication/repair protein RecF [Firmicutes bacterium]|nr:DNA replication/repair protein RecF [Bacillota bacterium]